MRYWPRETKTTVIKLRRQGKTFGELTKTFGVSKSTLHYWFRNEVRPEKIILDSKERIKQLQRLGALANKKKRILRIEGMEKVVFEEVSKLLFPKSIKKALLSMLYWAEGAKGRNEVVNFANTDPKMIKAFIDLLRDCFDVEEQKFRIRLHLHDYHDEDEIKNYWSKLTRIPLNQFTKTYWKKRSKNKTFRQNSHGICFLKYNSLVLREEIMSYAAAVALRLTINEPVSGKI